MNLVSLGRVFRGTKAELIMELSAAAFGMPSGSVTSSRSGRKFIRPRYAAIWIISQTPYGISQKLPSLPVIGKILKRDHTTILYSLRRVREMLLEDPGFSAKVAEIQEALRAIDTSIAISVPDLKEFGIRHGFKAVKNPSIAEIRLSVQVRRMGAVPENRQMPVSDRVGERKGMV